MGKTMERWREEFCPQQTENPRPKTKDNGCASIYQYNPTVIMDEIDALGEEVQGLQVSADQQQKRAPWSGEKAKKSQVTRENLFEKLKEYETKRRSVYSSKLDSMSLYWKSYKDLLSASLQETGRAERLVLGTCRAHEQYSNAMQAIHDDVFLDEKGNVASDKLQKRLANSRSTTQTKSITVVKEIRESHGTLANRFGENAKHMDQEIAETIQTLHSTLKTKFAEMESLGSSIIEELEKTEQEVTKAWGKLLYHSMHACSVNADE